MMSFYLMLAASLILTGGNVHAASGYHLAAAWGTTGSGAGQFLAPMGIAVDKNGFVYVADSRNTRVQKLSPEGGFVMQFGEPGNGPGQFEKPVDVALGPDGTIYVSDYDQDRVQAFSPDGKLIATGAASGTIRIWNATTGTLVPADPILRFCTCSEKRFTHVPGDPVYLRALLKITQMRRGETVPVLINALEAEGEDTRVRLVAAALLGRLGHTAARAVPALEKLRHDVNENLRHVARDALKDIRGTDSEPRSR